MWILSGFVGLALFVSYANSQTNEDDSNACGDEELYCWTCDAASISECDAIGKYTRCYRDLGPDGTGTGNGVCVSSTDLSASGQVKHYSSYCGRQTECDGLDYSTEVCQEEEGDNVCVYCHGPDDVQVNSTGFDRQRAACALEWRPNPCIGQDPVGRPPTPGGAKRSLDQRFERSIDGDTTRIEALITATVRPDNHVTGVNRRDAGIDQTTPPDITQYADGSDFERKTVRRNTETDLYNYPSDIWCKSCDFTADEEDCLANGEWEYCPDDPSGSPGTGAICVREEYTDDTGTYVRRGCGRRETCYPAAIHGPGQCGTDEDGLHRCFSCGYDDENDGDDTFGIESDVYRCQDPATQQLSCFCRGDPHCFTFDQKRLDLVGNCPYTMVQDGCSPLGLPVNDSTWHVATSFTTNAKGSRSWVTSVTIVKDGEEVVIGQGLETTLNGVPVTTVPDITEFFQFTQMGKYRVVTILQNAVSVAYNGKKNVEIIVPKYLQGDLCGLCGNANGFDVDDDTLGPMEDCSQATPGDQAANNTALTASWVHDFDNVSNKCLESCVSLPEP